MEYDKFLSHIVFTDDAKFQISGCVSWHNCVIWVSEPSREHLEYEQNSPKVNVWCVLTHERVVTLFCFDEDITTSNSFLDMLKNYALPQLSSSDNLILQLDGEPAYVAHIDHDCLNLNFPGQWLRKERPIAWPPYSHDLMPFGSLQQLQMLQSIWQEMGCRQDVCRAIDSGHCEVFCA